MVADIADRVLVMHQGNAVETGTVEQVFHAPVHSYTKALLAAVPRLGAMNGSDFPRRFPLISQTEQGKQEDETEQDTVVPGRPILEVRDTVTRFPLRSGILNRVKREVHAVENVSFDLWPGETLALVGSPAAVNPPPDGRCSGWWRRRRGASPSTVSASTRYLTVNCRRYAGIFSLYSRSLCVASIRAIRWVLDYGAAAGA